MFRNREWVINVFSVELAVNLQVYVRPKVIGLVFYSFIVPHVKDCLKFCFHMVVVSKGTHLALTICESLFIAC